MKHHPLLLGCLLATVMAAACGTRPAPPPALPADTSVALLQIGIASSAAEIVPLIEAAYAPQNPAVQLQFILANGDTLLADLGNGLLDAALVHHIPDDNGRYFNPVALDGLVILVHPQNPVEALTLAEVQSIFSGRITNWQAVGGPAREIVLFNREPGSGLRTMLRQRLLAGQPTSPNALLQTGSEAMLAAVAESAAAIGYSSMSSAGQNSGVKMVQIDGRLATPTTTAAQSYPLTAPLYFVATSEQEPAGELRALLAWLQSAEGQAELGSVFGRIR